MQILLNSSGQNAGVCYSFCLRDTEKTEKQSTGHEVNSREQQQNGKRNSLFRQLLVKTMYSQNVFKLMLSTEGQDIRCIYQLCC